MHVAVCIVGYKNANDIQNCLIALEASTYSDFEIVICENGGRQAWSELTETLPSTLQTGQRVSIILAPGNLGYAGGVNLCLAQARDAEAWWILNPDTKPEPGALANLVDRLSVGDCEFAGGTLHNGSGMVESFGGGWNAWLGRSTSIGFGRRVSDPVDAADIERRMAYTCGASMIINRRFLEVVGAMREDYFLYCEEVDWCFRATTLGMRLGFASEALVLHYQGTTTGSVKALSKRTRMPVYLETRNTILVTRDHFPKLLPIVAVAVISINLLRFLRRGAWRQLAYVIDGWRAGLTNERGPPAWLQT